MTSPDLRHRNVDWGVLEIFYSDCPGSYLYSVSSEKRDLNSLTVVGALRLPKGGVILQNSAENLYRERKLQYGYQTMELCVWLSSNSGSD